MYIALKKNILISYLDEDAVILDTNNGRYILVNGTATKICKFLREDKPISINEICNLMADEYENSKTMKDDILEFINNLADKEIVKFN